MIETLFIKAIDVITNLVQLMFFMSLIGITMLVIGSAIAWPTLLARKVITTKRGRKRG